MSKEEPEQYVEEEIVSINQKTGKLERKLIRKPLWEIDESIEYGD